MQDAPSITVLAGPNGAGKSTLALDLLPQLLDPRHFVNADDIAREQSPARPDSAALAAGRSMLKRLGELAIGRKSFAFETTLASRHFAPWLEELIASGYSFHLIFLEGLGHVENEFVSHEELLERAFESIATAATRKASFSYGPGYVLVIAFDDFMWFGTNEDRERLRAFVDARLPSWRLNVETFYVLGISGRTLLSFPSRRRQH
jgi:hypothetical protein